LGDFPVKSLKLPGHGQHHNCRAMGSITIRFFISKFPIRPSENKCGKCLADMLISLLWYFVADLPEENAFGIKRS
jgi:hypothetical protein